MARHSRANRSGPSWSPVIILLCLLICPLALLGHANAQGDDQEPLGSEGSRQDLGDVIGIDLGTTYCKGPSQPLRLSCDSNCDSEKTTADRNLQRMHSTTSHISLANEVSCVGVMQNGKVEILVNDQGNRITPSYVAFTDEERLVGDAAKNQYAANPVRTVYDSK